MDHNNIIDSTKDWHEDAFDLTRGIAAYTRSPLVARIAKVLAKHPQASIANAFNHKQVACKMWARDELHNAFGGKYQRIWVLGGWYGVLAAMLFDDARFDIGSIETIDLDENVAAIAQTLNGNDPRLIARTCDMYALDYAGGKPDLVVNTSCEHIADVRGWLDMLPGGTRVLLQSNDYYAEPTHINCVSSQDAFERLASLSSVSFAGTLPQKKYNRFMLIGTA
ncbi:MAG: class I SAM-dependent methyltransferase [Rhizobiaceae bacterium]|nr:class I SAM-dependent methyltransferase [Rhizobiaceae bacterium]